ncbi:MAG: PD40 domain-containing protein [Acidobacteria bacterium]|nr:PD40 domain-containing protein [Acidobacteriota bacterium]
MARLVFLFLFLAILLSSWALGQTEQRTEPAADSMVFPGERRFKNVKMLTFEGQNVRAYFSLDESRLILQSTSGRYQCNQIFTMNVDGSDLKLVSTEKGKAICPYFFPDGKKIIYASTHGADPACPPKPDFSNVWQVNSSFDLYVANADGTDAKPFLPSPGYDAEAAISPKGDRLVFTSQRNGDLDLYTVNLDGHDLQQLTTDLGYEGGASFSWDGSQIVYYSYHPTTPEATKRYRNLLSEGLIESVGFQIMVMNADGSNKRQITRNGFTNFAPFYHPDNKRIIFCSNIGDTDPRHPDFNLWMISDDGSGLEQITFFNQFDGSPMFTRDGKKLVLVSSRFNRRLRDTNIFVADWVEANLYGKAAEVNSPGSPNDQPAAGGSVERGKRVFQTQCSLCHKISEESSVGPGLKGILRGPSFPTTSEAAKYLKLVLQGLPGMPKIPLAEDEMNDLLAYLRTL